MANPKPDTSVDLDKPPMDFKQKSNEIAQLSAQPALEVLPISKQYQEELIKIRTKKYENIGPLQYGMGGGFGLAGVLNPDIPLFSRYFIPAMERDPHISYGMRMLCGPIVTKTKYKIESPYPEVQEHVQRQYDRFALSGIVEALTCMRYGFTGCEVVYKYNEEQGVIDYDRLNFIHPNNALPVINKAGDFVGMEVSGGGLEKPQYVPVPKCVWFVHEKRENKWFGRSRYEGAFIPWYETWQPKGQRAIRHLWMYKNAFDSGIIRYPEGAQLDPETGASIPNVLVATQMADQKESGATLILPSAVSADGIQSWDYIPPNLLAVPEGLFMYGDALRDEKWEGLGVPPEVAKVEDTGSFAGRRVPQQAFYSFLQEIANDIFIRDFDDIAKFTSILAFGKKGGVYTVKPISILQTLQEEEMGVVTGKLPGQNGNEEEDMGEEELDENGDPIEDDGEEGNRPPLSNGRIEDRDSNAFNKKEKSFKKNKGKKKSK